MTDEDRHDRTGPPTVAYGIDIGMYRHQTNGAVRGTSKSTFAWARADSTVVLMHPKGDRTTAFTFDGPYSVGRDMRDLADAIIRDICSGTKIAIGVEAPMWQPAPTEICDGSFDLFGVRFPQEQGSEWYLQSGAGALAKAMSTGRLLFSLVQKRAKDIQCATCPSETANIELFEGFVVGRWKLPGEETFENNAHTWDALTTAVGFHYARRKTHEQHRLAAIHAAGGFKSPIISHWETILNSLDMDTADCESDCLVVGFDSTSDAVRQAAVQEHERKLQATANSAAKDTEEVVSQVI